MKTEQVDLFGKSVLIASTTKKSSRDIIIPIRPPRPRSIRDPDQEKQDEMVEHDFMYGAVWLLRANKKIYACGDFSHCTRDDIMHNINVVHKMMIDTRKKYISKAYDADIFYGRDIPTLEEFCGPLHTYGEPVIELGTCTYVKKEYRVLAGFAWLEGWKYTDHDVSTIPKTVPDKVYKEGFVTKDVLGDIFQRTDVVWYDEDKPQQKKITQRSF